MSGTGSDIGTGSLAEDVRQNRLLIRDLSEPNLDLDESRVTSHVVAEALRQNCPLFGRFVRTES